MFFCKKEKKSTCVDERLSHIAFIMDGNGRWAKKRGMPREYGHAKGADNLKRVLRHCAAIGIKTVTVYAFSTENWSRPENEVKRLMELLLDYVKDALDSLDDDKIRVVFLGDKSALSCELRELCKTLEQRSAHYTQTLNIALNYGGRAEIVHACNSLLSEGRTHISEQDISSHIYTKASPDPDLIVRTGGDFRISNFLLWQSAYAELYFTPTLWPDLDEKELDKIVDNFYGRHRRFGGL